MTQPPTPPSGQDQPGGYPNAAPPPPADPPGFATPPPPAGPPTSGPPASGPPAPPVGGYAQPDGAHPAPAGSYAPPTGGYDSQAANYSASQPPASPPPAARAGFDPSTVAKSDWAFFGIGVLMLIFSFFGWFSVSSSAGGGYSFGGWNRWWVIIQLLLLASLGVRAVQVFAGKLVKEVPGIAQVGVAALMVLLYLIALIENFANSASDTSGSFSVSAGPGFGIWACLILSLGFVYFLALSKQKEGPLPIKVPGPANF